MANDATNQFPARERQRGFTLVEVLVTLAVASVLFATAVPSMQDFITRNHMSTEVNNFIASLYVARSEAVKRVQTVAVCPANSDFTDCIDSTDWQGGWMVFLDANQDGKLTNGSDEILQRYPALPSRFAVNGNQSLFAYDSSGQLYNPGSNGTYTFCDTGSVAKTRKITVSREGRVRVDQLTSVGCS